MFTVAGFRANQATPTIAVEPAAAMAMIAPRRKRATRPGAERSPRAPRTALGGTALAGRSTGTATAASPFRLNRGAPPDLLFLATEAPFGSAAQTAKDTLDAGHSSTYSRGFP